MWQYFQLLPVLLPSYLKSMKPIPNEKNFQGMSIAGSKKCCAIILNTINIHLAKGKSPESNKMLTMPARMSMVINDKIYNHIGLKG